MTARSRTRPANPHRPLITAALELWGRWECMPSVDWLPASLGYPRRTAESGAGEGRGSGAPSVVLVLQPAEPPELVVLVRRAVQGLPRHQMGALRRRYVPLEPARKADSRHSQRRERLLLARAEQAVARHLTRLLSDYTGSQGHLRETQQ